MAVYLTLDNEELAKAYDEISDSQFNNGLALIESLEIEPGHAVLDVGSGTGRLGRHVLGIIGPSGRYIGIDPLKERIKIAKEKNGHANAVFKIGVAEDLSFLGDNSMDVVYLNSVFHWINDKASALREIFRVLRPGGRIGLTTGAKELNSVAGVRAITDSVLKRKPYSEFVNTEDNALNRNGVTTTELIRLLTTAGFDLKSVKVSTITRSYDTAKDIIRHSEASSFGNYLNHVPGTLREQAKAEIEAELEKHRLKGKLKFDAHTIFAVAQKGQKLNA
jgi:arsenite methyltransferase